MGWLPRMLLALALVSCARDPLWVIDGPGEGGEDGVGGAGGGGASVLPACRTLSPPTLPLTLAGAEDFHVANPVLVSSSPDRGFVTLASAWTDSAAPSATQLRHATFAPWLSWPSAGIGPSLLADRERGASFRMAAADGERLAVLMSDGGDPAPPAGAFFGARLEAGSGNISSPTLVDAEATRTLFVVRSDDWFLVGTEQLGPNHRSLVMPVQPYGGSGLHQLAAVELGCASSLLTADAVATASGWLVAANSFLLVPDACAATDPVGVAGRILLARVSRSGELEPLGSLASPFPVLTLALESSGDGGWLAYITDEPNLPIYLVRVASDGQLLGNYQVSTLSAGRLATTRIGDLLAIAYVRGGGRIEVELRDDQGRLIANETVRSPTEIDGVVSGDIALLSSPNDDALLLAWSEVAERQQVRLARFDCSP